MAPLLLRDTKFKFHQVAGCPNVAGNFDGVSIPIISPFKDESSYIIRKGFHVIYVQAEAD